MTNQTVNPLKVLFCSPMGSVGGIAQWTSNILSYTDTLPQKKVELTWFYPTRSNNKGLPQTYSYIKRLVKGVRNYLPFIIELKKILKTKKFNLAHFSTSGSISFFRDYLALKICKKYGIRTSLHFHFGRIPDVIKGNSFEKKLLDLCIPYVDIFIAIDKNTYYALLDYGCKNVYYIPNPLSLKIEALISNFKPIRREKNLVIFAGHVVPTKGINELIQSCKDIPDIQLEIFGKFNESYRAEIISMIDEEFSNRIIFRGNCSLQEVIEAMKRCSVFVLPSYSEGFPNVIIESMACGTPIVATTVGAIPEMLTDPNGKCGLLVPPKDIECLKKSIMYILEDAPNAIEMGKRARMKVCEEYSMDKVWTQLECAWTH